MRGITVDTLSAGYGRKSVLSGISGSFPAGTVTLVLGPNGSGKSTLLRALAGGIPYLGSVKVDGTELSSMESRERGRRIGVVSQSPSLSFPFSVLEVVRMGRLPHRRMPWRQGSGDDGACRAAAEEMELCGLLSRRVTELSGGERQRTAIAQVIAQQPDAYILDEPSSALDPRHTLRLFGFLRAVAREGRTVIAAVHDINLAAEFGDGVWLLKDGRLAASGSLEDTLTEGVLSGVYGVPFVPFRDGRDRKIWRAG